MTTRKHRAFTLVELLVVIAIISVLAGMLLPALSNSINQVRAVRCLSNLKQIGFGFDLYAQAHGDWLPRAWNGGSGEQWCSLIGIPFFLEIESKPVVGTKDLVTLCPSGANTIYWNGMIFDYAMNPMLNRVVYEEKFGQVKRASTRLLLGDSDGSTPMIGTTLVPTWKALYKHNDKINILFADIHAGHLYESDMTLGECF